MACMLGALPGCIDLESGNQNPYLQPTGTPVGGAIDPLYVGTWCSVYTCDVRFVEDPDSGKAFIDHSEPTAVSEDEVLLCIYDDGTCDYGNEIGSAPGSCLLETGDFSGYDIVSSSGVLLEGHVQYYAGNDEASETMVLYFFDAFGKMNCYGCRRV